MVYNCRPQNTKNVLQVANIPLLPFPHLPIILKKNPKSKMIEVTYSHADMSNVPCYGHFLKDRVMPMIQFMTSAVVNQNRDCDRTLPRHELDRLYQALDRGTQIPMIFDISDTPGCGKGHLVYQGPMTNDKGSQL
jgi:hypothetical protein